MDEKFINYNDDPFSKWLLKHKNFIKFIRVNSFFTPKFPSDVKANNMLLTLAKMTHFYHYSIIPAHPEKPYIGKIHKSLSKSSAILARQHFFLQCEIYEQRMSNFQNSLTQTRDLILALEETSKISSSFSVEIDENALFWELIADSENATKLLTKDSYIVQRISTNEMVFDSFEKQSSIMHQILFSLKAFYDRKTMFLADNPVQEKFDQLLFHPEFYMAQEIDELFDTLGKVLPSAFTNRCTSIIHRILADFSVTDQNETYIFSISFFRLVFGYGVSLNSDYFFPKNECSLRLRSHDIRLEHICNDTSALNLCSDSNVPRDLVKSNPTLQSASEDLFLLSTMVSPIDILMQTHIILSKIKMYIIESGDSKTKEIACAFDTIFALFLLVLIASDIPNIEEVFTFVINFSPRIGLSGSLDYANATITAALKQCQIMLKNV